MRGNLRKDSLEIPAALKAHKAHKVLNLSLKVESDVNSFFFFKKDGNFKVILNILIFKIFIN
jgi:hypothetical protein